MRHSDRGAGTDLNFSPLVAYDPRDSCEGGEFIGSYFRVDTSEVSQERGLTHRGKPCAN